MNECRCDRCGVLYDQGTSDQDNCCIACQRDLEVSQQWLDDREEGDDMTICNECGNEFDAAYDGQARCVDCEEGNYDYDYCIHGVYVGGCGIDWMCGHCEMGEFTPVEVTRYQCIISGTKSEATGRAYRAELGWENSREVAEGLAEVFRNLPHNEGNEVSAVVEERVFTVWVNGEDD